MPQLTYSARLLLLGGVLLGALVPVLYLFPSHAAQGLVLLGLGLPALALVWGHPESGLIGVVFLATSLIPADALDVRLPFGGLELRDLALLAVLGILILRGLARGSLAVPWWPVGAPLLVFLILACVSALYALLGRHVGANWVFSDLRAVVFYSIYFVAAWTNLQASALKAVTVGVLALADLVVSAVILQQLLGADHPLLSAMSYSNWQLREVSTSGDQGAFGIVRVMPPGVVLVYFATMLAVCLLAFMPRRTFLRAVLISQIVYLGLGILLTYTRALWASAAVALGLILVALTRISKVSTTRCVAIGIVVVCLLAGACYLIWGGRADGSPLLSAIADRARSILTSSDTLSSDSLQWRLFETEQAMQSVSRHPLLGVGLGNSYRGVSTFLGEAVGWRTNGRLSAGDISRFTRFIHNSYLYIVVKMGLPGLASFLWFYTALVIGCARLYRSLPDGPRRAVALAILASSVGLVPWSLLHQHFVQAESTAVVGLLAGLAAGLHQTGNSRDIGHLAMGTQSARLHL